jgi:hypothetical protein
LKTETLEIDQSFGQEYQGKYLFKEISWAKRNHIIQNHTTYNKLSGEVENSNLLAIQAETIIASLQSQPPNKPVTLQKLLDENEGVPIELGELLSKVTNKLNSVGTSDLRFLLEQLDEKSRMMLFASFGYVKNSDGPQPNSENNQRGQSSSSA